MMCCCFNYLFNYIELELNACWELKELKIIIIIIKMIRIPRVVQLRKTVLSD